MTQYSYAFTHFAEAILKEEVRRLKAENSDLRFELLAAQKNRDEWREAARRVQAGRE